MEQMPEDPLEIVEIGVPVEGGRGGAKSEVFGDSLTLIDADEDVDAVEDVNAGDVDDIVIAVDVDDAKDVDVVNDESVLCKCESKAGNWSEFGFKSITFLPDIMSFSDARKSVRRVCE